MAISKQYVELMGGTITVHSKKGCGSSFTVEIPMELADPKQIPKMNGHQAASEIRAMSKERPDAAKIPIIAQSANAFKEDVQASLDSGMNGHISKPFNIDAVTTAIKQNIKR